MNCNLTYDKNKEITGYTLPNGEQSINFDTLLATSNPSKAFVNYLKTKNSWFKS
jgi:hypothetical protein